MLQVSARSLNPTGDPLLRGEVRGSGGKQSFGPLDVPAHPMPGCGLHPMTCACPQLLTTPRPRQQHEESPAVGLGAPEEASGQDQPLAPSVPRQGASHSPGAEPRGHEHLNVASSCSVGHIAPCTWASGSWSRMMWWDQVQVPLGSSPAPPWWGGRARKNRRRFLASFVPL